MNTELTELAQDCERLLAKLRKVQADMIVRRAERMKILRLVYHQDGADCTCELCKEYEVLLNG